MSTGARVNDEVLIVDDSARDAFFLLRALNASAPKIRWVFEEDPEVALRRFTEGTAPALLVLDLRMPKLSGHDFLAAISKDGATAVPVVVVTTSSDEDERSAVMAAGASAFLTKPDSLSGYQQLASRIVESWLGGVAH